MEPKADSQLGFDFDGGAASHARPARESSAPLTLTPRSVEGHASAALQDLPAEDGDGLSIGHRAAVRRHGHARLCCSRGFRIMVSAASKRSC